MAKSLEKNINFSFKIEFKAIQKGKIEGMVDRTIWMQHHLKKDWLSGKVTTNKVSDWQSNYKKVYIIIIWQTDL